MDFFQKTIRLPAFPRGFHLITDDLLREVPEIARFSAGMCQVFIRHTSAGLTVNENADATVRTDFATFFDKTVPENDPDYLHTYEGPDDMPAHLKSSLTGHSVLLPIQNGRFALGTWQGVYLCEFRNDGGRRQLVVSVWGS